MQRNTMFHGKSLALIQNSFLRPPGTETDGENDEAELILRQKRLANVYDAVAGTSFFLHPCQTPTE